MHGFGLVLQPPGQQVLRCSTNSRDQVEDYARRKGMSVTEVEPGWHRIWGMTRTDSQICHFSYNKQGAQ